MDNYGIKSNCGNFITLAGIHVHRVMHPCFSQPYQSKSLIFWVEPWSQACFCRKMAKTVVLEGSTEDHLGKQRRGRIRNPTQFASCLAEDTAELSCRNLRTRLCSPRAFILPPRVCHWQHCQHSSSPDVGWIFIEFKWIKKWVSQKKGAQVDNRTWSWASHLSLTQNSTPF